ncbi:hypothetical protein [Eleftheria terrae]|uniref:hypothetical protein n=1 Tax=Eleftheria terrae TaxID=1597781 RepID=UPI00263AD4D6|nr:hypothetical protein [Eleftheria terrae]WKB52991.1 hypothetical protein N7L95_00890 [Eleftheria terrae]
MAAVLNFPVVSHAVDATAPEKLRLKALFLLAAASDGRLKLPRVSESTGWIYQQAFPEIVLDVLDHHEIAALLLTVLRESPCPTVLALRMAMADRYAIENAGDIARALQ